MHTRQYLGSRVITSFRVLRLLVGVVCASGALALQSSARAADAIEAKFTRPGPETAVWEANPNFLPSGYAIAYPSSVAQPGSAAHPVVVLGLGTGSTIDYYQNISKHLATWGFIVLLSKHNQVGDGTELLLGAVAMHALATTEGNFLNGKIDRDKIAVAGHSQGALGAVNATINSGGLIKTTVAWAMPDTCNSMDTDIGDGLPLPDLSQLTTPIFFVRGWQDELATETGEVSASAGTQNTESELADATYIGALCGPEAEAFPNRGVTNFWLPGVAGPAVKAARTNITQRVNSTHPCDLSYGTVDGAPLANLLVRMGFGLDVPPDLQGMPVLHLEDHCWLIDHHKDILNRDRKFVSGYTTAWLKYILEGDPDAKKAFVGSNAELKFNPNWANYGIAHPELMP